jgi:DNA topoisomerase-2
MPQKDNKNVNKNVKKVINVEDVYKRKTHHQHILDLPDTYIGSTTAKDYPMYIVNPDYDEEDPDQPLIIESTIKYIAGLFKIFDEMIVNARDHSVKDKTCRNIKIDIDRDTGAISVWNDGNGIPVVYHKEQQMYLPEMIFGHLLTSSNYDIKGKTVGGKNGYGSKLANIYSKEFIVHTIGYNDMSKTKNSEKIEYRQVFRDNMRTIDNPTLNGVSVNVELVKKDIEKNGALSILKKHLSSSTKTFTHFTFSPDYERFGMTGLTSDMYNLLIKRCHDIAACTISSGIKVCVNGSELKFKDFVTYVKSYYAKSNKTIKIIHEQVNTRWEVAIAFSESNTEGERYISFVNGTTTLQGGTHVDHFVNNVTKKVTEYITSQKDYKDYKIQPSMIKRYLTFFVNAVVEDPTFGSQTKEKLDSKISDWCSHKPVCADIRCDFSSEFIEKLCKSGLMNLVVEESDFKNRKELSKGEKGKVGRLTDIPKLIDAEQAGKRNSASASLFLTEGDSAKAFAVSGIGVIGSKKYGVFPLRGKLLNVRNASIKQIKGCAEFNNLKAIFGLKQGKKYKNVSELRYGSVIILTDQDPDGSHIKGLVINMFEYFWPELLQMNGFIKAYNTYIVKAHKKTDKKKKDVKIFYTIPEFHAWRDSVDMSKWVSKYYKGLGSSDEKEARESFQNFEDNLIDFKWEETKTNVDGKELETLKKKLDAKSEVKVEKTSKDKLASDDVDLSEEGVESKGVQDEDEDEDDNDNDNNDNNEYTKSTSHKSIVKAFDENKANERKVWLKGFKTEDMIQYKKGMGHITYSQFIDGDLRIFSTDDNVRSISSMIDGLKPSQRMILYGSFKRGRNSGESKVAQLGAYVSEHTDYHHGETSLFGAIVGMAQNFPGSNNINLLEPIGNFGYRRQGGKEAASPRYIFTKLSAITNTIFRQEDDGILKYNEVDGNQVEPVNFEPILPMILVNGGKGIGTGYGFEVPLYNPKDIVLNLKKLIKGQNPMTMMPWFNGYKNNEGTKYLGSNKYEFNGLYEIHGKTVRITEIPIINGWIEPFEAKIDAKISVSKDDDKKIDGINNNVMNNYIDMTLTFRGNELQTLYKKDAIDKFLYMKKNMSYNSMYLFDQDSIIRKYENATEILTEFYKHRLDIYGVRKAHHLKKLENELNIYKYKVMFIREYLNDTIQIARVTSSRVIEQLEELNAKGLPRYPRLAHDHRSESDRSYRYLTDMTILSLTTDKIADLEKKMEHCKADYDDYLNTSIENIWLRELDEFLKVYDIFLKEWSESNIHGKKEDNGGKGGKKIKVTKALKPEAKEVVKINKASITIGKTDKKAIGKKAKIVR